MIRFVFDQRRRSGSSQKRDGQSRCLWQQRWTRREWLRVGALAGLGLAGPLSSATATSRPQRSLPGFGRAKSVIFVYASGGQSHLDMWDPKPNAPLDVRGEFQSISTSHVGLAFTEHIPQIARLADRFTLVRSMSHEDLDHGSATYLTLTGRYHQRRSSNPDPSPNDFPALGAVLRRVRPSQRSVYDAVHVNGPALVPTKIGPGQNGGLLGHRYDPLVVGDVSRQAVALPGLANRPDLPTVRHSERLSLKESLEQSAERFEASREAMAMSHLHRQAYEMLASPVFRRAFDLSAESPRDRDRYGRNRSGQACLLARRLVEAGVPLINVIWNHSNRGQDIAPQETDQYGWDTHNDIFDALRVHLLPRFDRGFSALLEDLDSRGLLDETLVICVGEFGRAPRVALEPRFAGQSPGRKHWASVYSMVAAGAGVARGGIVGASDRIGASPVTERYGPWDVTATIYHALGIDASRHFHDDLHRPYPISVGQPIGALYGG